ncbi:MAG: DUF4129 domain-containing protein [Actinomycetota bacterium]|nr:DUF4129 domain-containing protein [Actinomycetota bacterium]
MKNPGVLLLAGVTVALLLVVAALAPETGASFQGGSQDHVVVADTPALFDYLMLFVTAVIFSAVLLLRATARRQVVTGRRGGSPWRRAVFLLLLLAVWVTFPGVQTLVTDVLGKLGDAGETLGRSPGDLSDGLPESVSSRLAGYVVTLAAVTLILGLAALVLLLWHKRPQPDDGRDAEDEIFADIDAGLEDLSTIQDPRAAVIACYARMLNAAAGAGVVRRPSDTPMEALHRLLENHGVTEPSARRLTLLFETAKFSNHRIDEAMRTDALDALLEVRSELGVPV